MVLKNVGIATICATLAWSSSSIADEYRPDEFLRLDLSKALLSPKPLGPPSEFAPVQVEAKAERGSERGSARAESTAESKLVKTKRIVDSRQQGCAYASGETPRRSPHEARATTRQSLGRAGVRYANPGLALQVGRHLQLEAVGQLSFRVGRLAGARVIGLSQNLRPRVKKPSAQSQVERATFVVIRRGTRNGDCDTREARPDQTSFIGPLGIHHRARRVGRSRRALSQPGRGSSEDHERACLGRCIDKLRGGVGESRPACAHAGGMLDRRKLQDDYWRRIIGSAARERFYLEGAARGSSARAGSFLPGAV